MLILNVMRNDGPSIIAYDPPTRYVDSLGGLHCTSCFDNGSLTNVCAPSAIVAISPFDSNLIVRNDASPNCVDMEYDLHIDTVINRFESPYGCFLGATFCGACALHVAFDPGDSTALYFAADGSPQFAGIERPGLYRVRFDSCPNGDTSTGRYNLLLEGICTFFHVEPQMPNVVYASTSSSLYRSTDRGASWAQLGIPSVNALCHDSTRTVWIAAGGKGVGIFRSTDGGVSFAPVSSASGSAAAYDARTGAFYVADTGRIMRSTDGGATFSMYNNVFSKFEIVGLAVSPTGVLCGTRDGLYEITSEEVGVADATGSPTVPTLSIAPNPAHDAVRVMLDGMSRDARVTITDMLGRVVRDCTPQLRNAPHVSIDLESLPSGSYLVRVADGGRSVTRVLLVE